MWFYCRRQRTDSTQTSENGNEMQHIPPIKRIASYGIVLNGTIATADNEILNVEEDSGNACLKQEEVAPEEKQDIAEIAADKPEEKETTSEGLVLLM